MPTSVFFDLPEEKRQTILNAAISEFAEFGYRSASTNAIVKKSEISKGSLFKYFENKEDLYFYILDRVTSDLLEGITKEISCLSPELFQRVLDYSALEFSWYLRNPEKAKLIIRAFSTKETAIRQKTADRYAAKQAEILDQLRNNIDSRNLRWDKQKTFGILKWFLQGFNEDFRAGIPESGLPVEELCREYSRNLKEYLEMLKLGLVQ